jgi:hypothetical protein
MATTLGFKDIIDKPEFRPFALCPNAHAAGVSICGDRRNNETRHPSIFQLASAAIVNQYHTKNDGWMFLGTPALTNTFGAGACAVFCPHQGPRGSIGSGCSTTKIVTSTTWTIGANLLANRGDGIGFRVRIIGKSSGGSGKVEERTVVANSAASSGALTFYLDQALSFTPASGDTYEFLSGRVMLINTGAAGAGQFKYYDLVLNVYSGNLSITNLPTLATDSYMAMLDEQYVPYDRKPGEGFVVGSGQYDGTAFYCLTATGSASGTLTGQSSGGDASVLQNEYRNFQIRIVEDTGIPTAVGQRRLITSHTAGASPVYTLSAAWTVTPSSTCKYVIENCNFLLLVTGGTGNIYAYNPTPDAIVSNAGTSVAADSWNSSIFAARGANFNAGGSFEQSFGIEPDIGKYSRHSFIWSFRGGATVTCDLFDLAGAATGAWSLAVGTSIPSGATTITTGSCWAQDPVSNEGKYMYLMLNVTSYIFRFDMKTRTMEQFAQLRYLQSGTAAVGNRLACSAFIDGNTKVGFLHVLSHVSTMFHDILLQR